MFNFQGAIKKIQPLNENWIPGLKNIQRVSCSFAASLCSHLFPLQESAGSLPAWQGSSPGTVKSRGWNVEFGWWEDGGFCVQKHERELEKNENERKTGFPVDRRQATKKTASGLAHRHSLMGTSAASTYSPIAVQGIKKQHFTKQGSVFISGAISFANAALVNILIGSFCNRNSFTRGQQQPGGSDLFQKRGWVRKPKGERT